MSLMEQKRNETPLEEARRKWGEVTEQVRSSSVAWKAMLATAARNHKYSFRDQLMIHSTGPRPPPARSMTSGNNASIGVSIKG